MAVQAFIKEIKDVTHGYTQPSLQKPGIKKCIIHEGSVENKDGII